MSKSNRALGFVFILLSLMNVATLGTAILLDPATNLTNFAVKQSGGCAFSCAKTLVQNNAYCSGLATKSLTTKSANPVLIMQGVFTSTDFNITNGLVEIQMDLTTDLNNNIYGSPSNCGTTALELGKAQFYPKLNLAFSTSLTATYPFSVAATVLPGTYFGSVSVRYFSGDNGTAAMSWRINTPGTNSILLIEVSI